MNIQSNQGPSVRVERACKPCRDLKVRCVPPRTGETVCQKCQRSGACCLFQERRHRNQRKVDEKRVTVEILEAKLAVLTKRLEENISQQRYPESQIHTLQSIHTPSSEVLHSHATLQSSSLPSSIPQSASVTPSPGGSFIERLFRDGVVTATIADLYLSNYREMCLYFPFVIIPKEATVSSLLRSQSLLLHAILAVASNENKSLQIMLDKNLRRHLLEAVLIDGIRSIEILQAFVFHLAWEHFFYVPKKRHSDQMLQIAISMCADMGLEQSPKEASGSKIGLNLDHHYSVGGTDDDLFFSKSARRAYIGCYYLSIVSNWVWRKPTNFHRTDYIMECARSLSKDPEYDSDKHIETILQIQALGNEYHQALLSSDHVGLELPESDEIPSHLQSFQAKMNDILSSEQSNCLLTRLCRYFATSYAHELDHLTPCLWKKSTSKHTSDMPYNPRTQVNIFMVCLSHAKAFVESFLSIPLAQYSKLSAVQWWGLICNVIFLYTLSIGVPRASQWNTDKAREMVKLEIYLDLLCYRMQSITESRGERLDSQDLFSLMGKILANVKTTYEQLETLSPSSYSVPLELGHGSLVFGKANETQSIKSKSVAPTINCPAFPVRLNMPELASIPTVNYAQALDDLFLPLQIPSMSLWDDTQREHSWLGNTPNFSFDPEMNNWDFDMV